MVVDAPRRPVLAGLFNDLQFADLVRRPVWLAILTVALVGYPVSGHAAGVSVATVTPADVGAVLLVGVAGFRVLAGRDLDVLRSRLMICPVLVMGAALLTTMWSTNPSLSIVGAVRYAELFCLVPLAVVLVLRDRFDVVLLLGAVVALGAVEGIIGTYQSVTGTGAGYAGETIRAIGTFSVSDQIAMATVVSSAQVVLLAVALRGPRRVRPWAAGGAAALMVPLFLSLSRGALLATVAAAVAMVVAAGLLRAARTLLVVVAIAVFGFVGLSSIDSTVGARFTTLGTTATQPDKSVQDRYDLWSTAVSIWQTSPVTGVGIKQFAAFRDSHAPLGLSSGSEQVGVNSYTRGELLSPHNEYLLLLSEQGVLGLGSYLLLLGALATRHLTLLRRPQLFDVHDVMRLVAFGVLIRFLIDDLYGDLSGSTAVLYSVLLGVQLRSAVSDRKPLLSPASHEPVGGKPTRSGVTIA